MAGSMILGCHVTVKKTEGEYTISGPGAEALHADFTDRGFRPGKFHHKGQMFTIDESTIVGSFEANRIRLKLNSLLENYLEPF